MAVSHTELRQAEKLASLLDDRFRIPGTGIRFGIDTLIGLVPGLGDAAGLALSAYPIYVACKGGLPRRAIARMLFNVGIDATLGSLPIIGDIFDLFWQANRKNLRLIEKHLDRSAGATGRRSQWTRR